MKTEAQTKVMLNRLLAVSVLLQKANQRTSPQHQPTIQIQDNQQKGEDRGQKA
jgi:hypothetical protein